MPTVSGCRSCGEKSLKLILKCERPATARPTGSDPTLMVSQNTDADELFLCPRCALVQRVVVDGSPMTAPCDSLNPPARQLIHQVIASQKLRPTSLVMAIGSRDGRLLGDYQAAGIPVLGIEPAVRLAELARLERGVPTLCRRFNKDLALQLVGCGQPADVVHLHHVLPLVADLDPVIAGLPVVLKDSGVAIIEVPYVKPLVERGELAAWHYSHLSYFSLTSLVRLLSRHTLVVHDVERVPEGSGGLRLFVGKRGETSTRVATLLADEKAWGVDRVASYQAQRPAKVA
jgi:hypothetical protein